MNKLRVGVILPNHMTPEWVCGMMKEITNSSHADVIALAFAHQSDEENRADNKLYHFLFNLDQRLFRPSPNPWELSDIRQVIHSTQLLGENIYERISRLKAMRLDVLLNLSLAQMPKSLLDVARFGVWSLRCNDTRVTVGSEIGWLEILNDVPVMHCDIEIEREGTPRHISGSVIATNPSSVSLNQRSFFWRASHVVPRVLSQLYTKGEHEFFNRATPITLARKASLSSSTQSISIMRKQALQIFKNKIWRRIFPQRWALMAGKSTDGVLFDWSRLNLKVPSVDTFWADPFLLKKQGKVYLFFEEYVYETKRGHISCAVLDENGSIGESRVVLERPYHLSYPFIFEHRGEFYMIPETAQNRAIEVYRCTRFPDQWEFHKTLIPDVQAVDTTLFEHSTRWWVFVNIAHAGGSTWDELHLFYADDPLSNDWTPHPLNPVVSDVRSARPAGRNFSRDGGLIRPSQDSSMRYGYALNFNRITKLNIYEYEEELLERIEPTDENFLAVHTYNASDDFIVTDVLLKK